MSRAPARASDGLMMIVTLGYREYACTPEHAAKLLAVMAPLREVEMAKSGRYDEWVYTGAGAAEAISMRSGKLVAAPPATSATRPKPKPGLIPQERVLALTFDGDKP